MQALTQTAVKTLITFTAKKLISLQTLQSLLLKDCEGCDFQAEAIKTAIAGYVELGDLDFLIGPSWALLYSYPEFND